MNSCVWLPAYTALASRRSLRRHRIASALLTALAWIAVGGLFASTVAHGIGAARPTPNLAGVAPVAQLSIQARRCVPWATTLGRWEGAYVCRVTPESKFLYAKMLREP